MKIFKQHGEGYVGAGCVHLPEITQPFAEFALGGLAIRRLQREASTFAGDFVKPVIQTGNTVPVQVGCDPVELAIGAATGLKRFWRGDVDRSVRKARFHLRIYRVIRAGYTQEFQENILILQKPLV